MSYLDEIALKRQESRQKQASENLHKENLNAVKDSGKASADATFKATSGLAKTDDIDSLIKEVKEVQLAALLNTGKPSIILTDQTDLGDRLTKLADDIAASINKLDSSESDGKQLDTLKALKDALDNFTKSLDSSDKVSQKAAQELLKAVKSINVAPVVNVPEPKVTVTAAKIDTKPLEKIMQQYFTPPEVEAGKVDLECYKAQDISDSGDKQYVGFVNPTGGWYIIENDVKGNKLRYLFGISGYSKAFKDASSYEYSLLNEAINALPS